MKNNRKLAVATIISVLVILAVFFVFKQTRRSAVKESGVNFETEVKIPFDMPEIPEVSFPDRICDISNYGAVGDGQFMNTKNFAAAIADCAERGGGKVVVPKGNWLTGPIHFKNNINLQIDEDAKIIFSDKFSDYLPVVFSRFEGIELYNYSPFIYGRDCENIAITGAGELDGQGEAWLKWSKFPKNLPSVPAEVVLPPRLISANKLYDMAERSVPVEKRIFGGEQDALQPSFIQFTNCDKILIEGIKITESPGWTIHPIYSSNMIIRNIRIETEGRNTDGVAIDSSKNILVRNSKIRAGDDAIVIKSGKDKDGWRVGKPSENIVIRDIQVEKSHSAIAIGSEMSGGIRNVLAANIDVKYSDFGIRFKSMRGRGGVVEKIWIENIKMKRILSDMIQMDLDYGTPPAGYAKDKPPIFRDITMKNMEGTRAKNAIVLRGLPESPIENLTLENINLTATRGIRSENLKNKNFKNIVIEPTK